MNSLTKDFTAIQEPNISVSEVFQIFVQLLLRNGEEISDCLENFDEYEIDNAGKLIEILQKKEMDIQSFLDERIQEAAEDFRDIHINLILFKRFFYGATATIIPLQIFINVYFKEHSYQNVLLDNSLNVNLSLFFINNFILIYTITVIASYFYLFFFSKSSIYTFLLYKNFYVILVAAKAIYNRFPKDLEEEGQKF